MNAHALPQTNTLFGPASLSAMLREDYIAWSAGIFRVYVLHPQRMDVLRDATSEQLNRRQIFIARMKGRAYKTEYMNIRHILSERAQRADEMLEAARAQQAKFVSPIPDHASIDMLAELDLAQAVAI